MQVTKANKKARKEGALTVIRNAIYTGDILDPDKAPVIVRSNDGKLQIKRYDETEEGRIEAKILFRQGRYMLDLNNEDSKIWGIILGTSKDPLQTIVVRAFKAVQIQNRNKLRNLGN